MLYSIKMKLNNCTFMRGLSEFSSTALFMIMSCMGCTMNDKDAGGHLVSSIIYGLLIVVVMHIFGFISGAHSNPCVSIACYLLGYISGTMMILYVLMQFAGAAFGYLMLLQILPQSIIEANKLGVGVIVSMQSLSYIQILIIEGFLTSVLVLAWCALWDVRSGRFLDSVTLRMGCLVTVCHLAGGQLTGATMNPARILIPSLYKGNPESVALQLGGQLVASIIVPQFWQFAFTHRYRPLQPDNSERPSQELYLTP